MVYTVTYSLFIYRHGENNTVLGALYGPFILHMLPASVHRMSWMHLAILQIQNLFVLGRSWNFNSNVIEGLTLQWNPRSTSCHETYISIHYPNSCHTELEDGKWRAPKLRNSFNTYRSYKSSAESRLRWTAVLGQQLLRLQCQACNLNGVLQAIMYKTVLQSQRIQESSLFFCRD